MTAVKGAAAVRDDLPHRPSRKRPLPTRQGHRASHRHYRNCCIAEVVGLVPLREQLPRANPARIGCPRQLRGSPAEPEA
jgi:hypothetical protein